MVFRPVDAPSRWEGVAVAIWIVLVQILLLTWIHSRQNDWIRFALFFLFIASVPLLLYVLYRTWVAFSLEYWIDRNAITVRWADVSQIIPLAQIRQVLVGQDELAAQTWPLDWPARYVHHPRDHETGHLAMMASLPPSRCVILDVGEHAFALSPAEPEAFMEAVRERVVMGPATDAQRITRRSLDPVHLFNADRLGLTLLIAGFVGSVLLFGFLMVRFPSLPDVMTVRYSAQGIPEQVRAKGALFLLPAIGLVAWLINGVWGLVMAFRRQLLGAWLLWGGTLVVQLCALLALAGLTGWR